MLSCVTKPLGAVCVVVGVILLVLIFPIIVTATMIINVGCGNPIYRGLWSKRRQAR